jgi:proteic killer suppression protein
MIRTFGCEKTKALFVEGKSRHFPLGVCKTGMRKLDYLNSAKGLEDLAKVPGNYFEALKGDHEGFYSIRVNNQYRIIFRFSESDAYDVRIIDYH